MLLLARCLCVFSSKESPCVKFKWFHYRAPNNKECFYSSQCMSLSKNDPQQNPKKRKLASKINNLFLTKSIMKKVMEDSLMEVLWRFLCGIRRCVWDVWCHRPWRTPSWLESRTPERSHREGASFSAWVSVKTWSENSHEQPNFICSS